MRLFAATLATETNTFSPLPTSLEAYKESVFFRPGEHPRDILRKFVDNAGRSARRRPHPIPNREVESYDARFSDCRHLRKQSRAPCRGYT